MAESLKHICFKDVTWLKYNNLHMENALDYFMLSPFYDKSCNNEILKMQSKYTNTAQTQERLRKMVGVEYSLVYFDGICLYNIHKVYRESPSSTTTVASYYVLDGSIYQSPDLYSVISSRLATSHYFLEKALNTARTLSDYSPLTGYNRKGNGRKRRTREELRQLSMCIDSLKNLHK